MLTQILHFDFGFNHTMFPNDINQKDKLPESYKNFVEIEDNIGH